MVDPSQLIHIDNEGNKRDMEDVILIEEESEHYEKTVNKIKTERVLNVSREQFGCPDLDGVTVEDVPLGAGAHWESRILGPEFMSYGSASGEVYISDLTLAYLEDTSTLYITWCILLVIYHISV